jgi:hypothetical protein
MFGHALGLPYIGILHRGSLGCMQYDAVQSCKFDGFSTKWSGGWWPWAAVVIFHPCLEEAKMKYFSYSFGASEPYTESYL